MFQNIRDIRERSPSRDFTERPVLFDGLSVAGFDGQESDADEKNPQWRRPFKSKYSIFYPKMCENEKQEKTSQVLDSQGMDHMDSQGIDQKEQLTDEDLIQEKDPKEDDKDQGSTRITRTTIAEFLDWAQDLCSNLIRRNWFVEPC